MGGARGRRAGPRCSRRPAPDQGLWLAERVPDVVNRGNFVDIAVAFVEAFLNFLIIAFVMFLVIKVYNRLRDRDEPAGPSEDILLLREIRDELRASRRS